MSELPTIDAVKLMSDEEVARLNRELTKKVVRNLLIFSAAKLAILLLIRQLAKSAAKNLDN